MCKDLRTGVCVKYLRTGVCTCMCKYAVHILYVTDTHKCFEQKRENHKAMAASTPNMATGCVGVGDKCTPNNAGKANSTVH